MSNLGKEAFIEIDGQWKSFHTVRQAYELVDNFSTLKKLLELLERAEYPLEEGMEEEVLLLYWHNISVPSSIHLVTVVDWNYSTDKVIVREGSADRVVLRYHLYRCKMEQRLCEIFNNRERNRK